MPFLTTKFYSIQIIWFEVISDHTLVLSLPDLSNFLLIYLHLYNILNIHLFNIIFGSFSFCFISLSGKIKLSVPLVSQFTSLV